MRSLYDLSQLRAYFDLIRRIWSTTTGDCIRTLVEGQQAIWSVAVSFGLRMFQLVIDTNYQANTPNSPQTQNTYSPPHTIAGSGCGTTRPHAASRRIWGTLTRNTALSRASASRAGSGLCLVARTIKSTYGTYRHVRSCRY